MSESRLVYSTEGGRVRNPVERPTAVRRPSGQAVPRAPRDGVIRIFRERGGRGGKVVTVIRGLPAGAALLALAADLKRLCGAGGTVKDRVIEIQGDHREKVAGYLRVQGYVAKLAGG